MPNPSDPPNFTQRRDAIVAHWIAQHARRERARLVWGASRRVICCRPIPLWRRVLGLFVRGVR